ncbi:hypothetical protein JTB14_011421 [Gonioctena quinquepunctata]|nr:hypothetical protein JTB14_011421 [Gonioctena quinquepunctata]
MKCTRSCKGCKGETCTNASDIVDNTNDGDEDEDDDDENENFEYGMIVDQQNTSRPAYRKIIQTIYGSNLDTDPDENDEPEETMVEEEEEIEESRDQEEKEEEEEGQETENPPFNVGKEVAHSVPHTEEPSTSKSPQKKRRKRCI